MANTHTSLHYHIVFSTKDRVPWIVPAIEDRVWTYLAGIAGQHGMMPLQIGGLEDHMHLVIAIPPTLSVSTAVQRLKGSSSRCVSSRPRIDRAQPGCVDRASSGGVYHP